MTEKYELSTAQRELLRNQPIARLATSTAGGEPYLVPVTFIVSEDEIVVVIDDKPKSDVTLRRVRNIKENSSVAVLLDHYEDDWGELWWVLIRGVGEILQFHDFSDKQQLKIPEIFREKYHQYKELSFAEKVFISINIEAVSSWRFDNS